MLWPSEMEGAGGGRREDHFHVSGGTSGREGMMSLLVVLGSGLGPVGHGGWRVQEAEAGPGLEASCGHLW